MIPKPEACQACPLYGDGMGFVPDEVPPGAQVVIIAQNPGEHEEAQGKPKVGMVGQIQRHQFVGAHLPTTSVGYANTLKCRMQKSGRRTNTLPPIGSSTWRQAVECCSGFLQNSLLAAPQALKVYEGEHAVAAGMGLRGKRMLHVRGTYLPQQHAYLVEHTGAVLPNRTPELRDVFHLDYSRIARLATGWRPAPYADDFQVFHTVADLQRFLLPTPDIIFLSLDLELGADGCPDTIGLARSPTMAGVFSPSASEVLQCLSEYLQCGACELIVHYGEGLELAWLLELVGRDAFDKLVVHDLGKLFHAYDPEYATAGRDLKSDAFRRQKSGGGSGSLAFIQSLYTWRPYHKHLLALAESWDAKAHYCMLDCVATWEAWHNLAARVRQETPQAWTAYLRDGITLPKRMVQAAQQGVLVDTKRFAARRQELRDTAQAQAAAIEAEFGPEIRPKGKHAKTAISMHGLKAVLATRGVKLPMQRRPNGSMSPTLDRAARQSLLAKHPELGSLEAYFGTQDTLSDFYKKGIVSHDGRCHAHASGFLASWRWRYVEPNLAQWPARERTVFVGDNGTVLVQLDTSAGEYRWFAGECQDPQLLHVFQTHDQTGDLVSHPHVQNAAVLFGVTPHEAALWRAEQHPLHARYVFAKNYIFRKLNAYRGGADSLRASAAKAGLKFSRKDIEAFDRAWDVRFPTACRWRDQHVARALQTRQTTNREWGYVRRYHTQDIRELANQALDAIWQSGIAGIINRTVNIIYASHGLWPLVNMHDGLVYQLPDPGWEPIARKIHQEMTQPLATLGGMVIPVDIAVGTRWGELQSWKH